MADGDDMRVLRINGEGRTVDAPDDMPLLWVLRDVVGLTGSKFGCGIAQCGACTVHVDGEAVRSCVLPVGALGTREVTTIEAIGRNEVGRRVQAAWLAVDVPQCGYCQTGQIMSAAALLAQVPAPDDAQINAAMAGNLCRCGTYARIRAAIKQAATGERTAMQVIPDGAVASGHGQGGEPAQTPPQKEPSLPDEGPAGAVKPKRPEGHR